MGFFLPIFAVLFAFLILFLVYSDMKARRRFKDGGIMYLGNRVIGILRTMFKGVGIIEGICLGYKRVKDAGHKCAASQDISTTHLFVADPDLAKSILIKDFDHFENRMKLFTSKRDYLYRKTLLSFEGSEWRALRSKLSPTFTTGKIRRLFPLFDQSGQKLMAYFQDQVGSSPDGEVDLSEGYSKYAMDVIATAVCGLDSQVFEQKEPSFFEKMGQRMQFQLTAIQFLKLIIMMSSQFLAEIFGLSLFDREAQNFFAKAIKDSIKRRQEANEKRNDFIQLMLEAREGSLKTEEGELDNFEKDAQIKEENTKVVDYAELLDDTGIAANAVVFMFAGIDTTHSLLLFVPYALALNPEIQERLRAEVDSVLQQHDGKMSYEAVSKMTYMDMVINETLRMYPPAGASDRSCTKEYKVPGTNFTLKKGDSVLIPVHAIHHDPEYYPDPEKFDPERFSPENKGNIRQCAFLPFGQGPRNCIGMRFALAEVKVSIAHLVHNFRIEPSKKTHIPMKLSKSTSLKPEGGMHLALRKIER